MSAEPQRAAVFTGPRQPKLKESTGVVLRHVVLFRLYATSEDEAQSIIDKALGLMVAMCECEHVLYYEVAHSLDGRKGQILVELIDFPNEAALALFKQSVPHQQFLAFIKRHADWTIGDYYIFT